MPLQKLDHVNVRTTQLAVMTDWYTQVLGLRLGERPNFPFGGAWMYAGDVAHVHLVASEGEVAVGSEVELKLEHFAFSATDLTAFLANLDDKSVPYRRSDLPEINLVQINVWDPDGNHIHVDFSADE